MRLRTRLLSLLFLTQLAATALVAQTAPTVPITFTAVPRVVQINSTFHPSDGKGAAPVEGVNLAIYADQTGGDPLWQETQNVSVDGEGHYSVLLGVTRNDGVPLELFTSGEPRWLGVRFQRSGETEQPRVLMASVPYALKAADAETLAGRPASAYLLDPSAVVAAAPTAGATRSGTATGSSKNTPIKPQITSGTAGNIAMFTNTTDLGNSVLFQGGTKIGLGTTTPADYFHVAFNDTSGGVTGYAVQNLGSGANSYSGMLFYDQAGNLGQFQGFNNSTHEYRINNIASNGSINFMLAGFSRLKIQTSGDVDMPGAWRKNGSLFLHNLGSSNTGVGLLALNSIFSGSFNNALGVSALFSNSSGSSNTAMGHRALYANVSGDNNTAVGFVAMTSNISGYSNTAVGAQALTSITNASWNTAIGGSALFSDTTGQANTAVGNSALYSNNSGGNNAATGYEALFSNVSGQSNTADGALALFSNTGSYNTAVGEEALYSSGPASKNTATGYWALYHNYAGNGNTAVGADALESVNGDGNTAVGNGALPFATGKYNLALGQFAGQAVTTGDTNILIANIGVNGESNTTRIGTEGNQTRTFLSGVRGVTTGVSNAMAVMIDGNGQLGTTNSSRRFKEDINDMGEASSNLLRLRPVTYRYKQAYADGSKPIDYGLIAEEVEDVYPDLVAKSADGQVETVQYQKLTPMLLNELQKQSQHMREQDETIRLLQARLAALEAAAASGHGSSTGGPGQR